MPDASVCQVCLENAKKYKCSACRIPFCSVKCYNSHQPVCIPVEETLPIQPTSKESKVNHGEEEDYIPDEELAALETDDKVCEALQNPHLRYMLSLINNAKDKEFTIHAAMLEPIFMEFAEECIRVVQDQQAS